MKTPRVFLFLTIFIFKSVHAEDAIDAKRISTPNFFANTRGIFSLGTGAACLGSDRSSQGVCLSRQQCTLQGGKVVGYCGVFSTCCALSACDVLTDSKNVVFSNPALSTANTGQECSYTVGIDNAHVCQIRIDLEIFSLAQPNTTIVNTTNKYPGYTCKDDVFQVTNLQAFSEIVPPLCGENSGQHLYVRVNASLNQRAVRINFKIADRTLRTNLPQATWRIRVTQLECYNAQGLYRDPTYLQIIQDNLPLRGRDADAQEKSAAREGRSTADRDSYLIAPAGCLQYYPDRSGTFETFNYNRGLGPYLADLHYATCFRRPQDVCGLKLTASKFQIAYNKSANNQLDTDCQSNPYVTGSLDSQDYLFIPEGETMDGLRGSKWCGTSAQGVIVASTPPGPLYVYFNSDNILTNGTSEVGYRITYNVLNNC